jgi:hypothetical protein
MIIDEENYLAHYGTLYKSGRYPYGSGGEGGLTRPDFLSMVSELKKQGLSDTVIAKGMGMSIEELRAKRTIANAVKKRDEIATAQKLRDTGMSHFAIGQEMGGLNESSVRALLAPGAADKAEIVFATAKMLKEQVAEKGGVDVGSGVYQQLGVTETKFKAALGILQEEGYPIHPVKINTAIGNKTEMKVLGYPGSTQKEFWSDPSKIKQIVSFTKDGGRSRYGLVPPLSIDPKRVDIKYNNEGGSEADGVIFVRKGVEDISLGHAQYAQVRVQVGDSHYLKGMAMYKDDMPEGVDLVFHTAKERTNNKLDAMKELASDQDNPFSSVITRQITKTDTKGNEYTTSVMNIVNEQGDWNKWSRSIASQVLSKQAPSLAKSQLAETFRRRQQEFNEIQSLTNPTVRRRLLKAFSDATDSAAVHLKAASLPRSRWHAILPIESLKPTEVYAPTYNNGERVALIRYPHGGTFEIPDLIVNNKNREGRSLIGPDAVDAIGINSQVAKRLSGADFDGDTVLVIPNGSNKIKIAPGLEALRTFEPQIQYKGYEGMPKLTEERKQTEMGKISNLITDMTIHQAPVDEVARAVKHSMVVIDAAKHGLDYKRSSKDQGISALKAKYQGGATKGASTLISRAGAKDRIPERKNRLMSKGGPIDTTTGERIYEPTNRVNYKTGTPALVKVERLANTTDAFTLVSGQSGTPMERLYAEHSNRLKSLANQARLEMINTPRLLQSKSAKKVYAPEVQTLNAKLAIVIRNRPREREAQTIAGAIIKQKRIDNPHMDDITRKKISFQAITEARNRTGIGQNKVDITQAEWNAIQAGAISDHKLSQILDKADLDQVKKYATPRQEVLMTTNNTSRARQMLSQGYTRAEVAEQLGVSVTTLDVATKEGVV